MSDPWLVNLRIYLFLLYSPFMSQFCPIGEVVVPAGWPNVAPLVGSALTSGDREPVYRDGIEG